MYSALRAYTFNLDVQQTASIAANFTKGCKA